MGKYGAANRNMQSSTRTFIAPNENTNSSLHVLWSEIFGALVRDLWCVWCMTHCECSTCSWKGRCETFHPDEEHGALTTLTSGKVSLKVPSKKPLEAKAFLQSGQPCFLFSSFVAHARHTTLCPHGRKSPCRGLSRQTMQSLLGAAEVPTVTGRT